MIESKIFFTSAAADSLTVSSAVVTFFNCFPLPRTFNFFAVVEVAVELTATRGVGVGVTADVKSLSSEVVSCPSGDGDG